MECKAQGEVTLEHIVKKKGRFPDSINQNVGNCYYQWINFFADCVKDAPEAPEGMSWKRNYLKRHKVAQELAKARQEEKKNNDAFTFFDEDNENLDDDN